LKGIEDRLEQIHKLAAAVKNNRDQMVTTAVRDTGFTQRECRIEVDMNLNNLQAFDDRVTAFARRRPFVNRGKKLPWFCHTTAVPG